MIKVEQLKNFTGFGDGAKYALGEYVHSQGMNKSPNGLMPLWNVIAAIDSGTLTDLDTPNWFAQAAPAATPYIYCADIAGNIFQNQNGVSTWALAYKPGQTTFGNGLIGDQKGRLLYALTRYLGKYDGTADYTTGTIAVTNGSPNVVGTGTTFTSGMVDRQIVINGVWYTIATFTDATHIALSANYAGSTASGLSYAIKVGWNDKFKDFGVSSLPSNSDYRPSDTYEDWVLWGNGNKVAVYNVQDDSFNDAGFTLPSQFLVRAIKSGRTGALIGANIGNRCIIFLWDAQATRSLAPWIWKNGNIQAIVPYNGEWIVITNREIFITNGYVAQPLVPMPDNIANQNYLSVHPQGGEIANDYLIIANSTSGVNRMRSGYWILHLARLQWEYAPLANGATYNGGNLIGPVFFDSGFRTHVGYKQGTPAKKVLGYISNSQPTSAYVITDPKGVSNNQKTAEGAKLNLGVSPYQTASYTITFNVSVKIYDFKRPLWAYAQQKILGAVHDRITVDGTVAGINNAEVGDEVTIMEGANAGFVAHITSITGQNTATEVWVLDTSFSSDIEANVFVQVMPFKLLRKHTISGLTELKELYFACKNSIKAQRYLLKIYLSNIGDVPVELLGGDFFYDDKGPFTTN